MPVFRDITFNARKRYLTGEKELSFWQDNLPEEYERAQEKYGEERLKELQREYILAVINMQWSRYLEFASYLREGIHLSAIGGKNPADEYNIGCEEYYETMEDRITEDMEEGLLTLLEKGIDNFLIPKPSEISTYLLDDSGDELARKSLMEALLGGNSEEYEETEEYEEKEEREDLHKEDETAENKPKKGFFASLFGKKK